MHPTSLLVEIHPLDAAALGIRNGDPVLVESRRATITAKALLTSTVQRGQVFLPMHHPTVNELTLNAVDPHSRQPSYKHCAVQIRPNP
jgi:assimilatory nitrate reductase catalytic subunit